MQILNTVWEEQGRVGLLQSKDVFPAACGKPEPLPQGLWKWTLSRVRGKSKLIECMQISGGQ